MDKYKTLNNSKHFQDFQHEPLDHTQPSIRLIEIKPGLSAEGLVRCEMSQTTIEAEYTCLSYRWGDDDPSTSKTILLKGMSFTVRQNLHDFLYLTCTEHEMSPVVEANGKYWIDALCIDQSNASERNHQVAQMGEIFTAAQRVHVWLGRTSDVDRMSMLLSSSPSKGSPRSEPFELQKNMQLIGKYILHNEYWNRAWVIQEIVLARKVVVSLDMTTLSLSKFSESIERLRLDTAGTPFGQFNARNRQEWKAFVCDKSLLFLLYWFRDKHCSLPYDRVFALLAVCQERDRLEVDYDMHWSNLAFHILRKARYRLCVCSADLVTRSLISGASKPSTENQTRKRRPMISFDGCHVVLHKSMRVEPAGNILHAQADPHGPYQCLHSLIMAFWSWWVQCELELYMHEAFMMEGLSVDTAEEESAKMPLPEALHRTMTLEGARLLWRPDPDDDTYSIYGDGHGWDIRIYDSNPTSCKVRIAISELQEIFFSTHFCVFSETFRPEQKNPFLIEWVYMNYDRAEFFPFQINKSQDLTTLTKVV